jgi:hypothetical protein
MFVSYFHLLCFPSSSFPNGPPTSQILYIFHVFFTRITGLANRNLIDLNTLSIIMSDLYKSEKSSSCNILHFVALTSHTVCALRTVPNKWKFSGAYFFREHALEYLGSHNATFCLEPSHSFRSVCALTVCCRHRTGALQHLCADDDQNPCLQYHYFEPIKRLRNIG